MVLVDTRQSEKGGQGEGEGDAKSILTCSLGFSGDTGAQETRCRVPNIFRACVLKHSDVHRKRVLHSCIPLQFSSFADSAPSPGVWPCSAGSTHILVLKNWASVSVYSLTSIWNHQHQDGGNPVGPASAEMSMLRGSSRRLATACCSYLSVGATDATPNALDFLQQLALSDAFPILLPLFPHNRVPPAVLPVLSVCIWRRSTAASNSRHSIRLSTLNLDLSFEGARPGAACRVCAIVLQGIAGICCNRA